MKMRTMESDNIDVDGPFLSSTSAALGLADVVFGSEYARTPSMVSQFSLSTADQSTGG